MHLLLRTILHILLSKRRSPLSFWGLSSVPLRAWPWDIDLAGHINNGRYFSLMDLGRVDLMIRSGVWKTLSSQGIWPVISLETISFRRSVKLWQRYSMETRVLGFDGKAVYFEQCMVVNGDIYVRAYCALRFIHRRSGKPADTTELLGFLGDPPVNLELPEWVLEWRDAASLPSARKPAPFRR